LRVATEPLEVVEAPEVSIVALTQDERVVAIWEYESRADYHRIQKAVTADPATARAQAIRSGLPQLFTSMTETFMTSTLPT
jgi:hypothetical protein